MIESKSNYETTRKKIVKRASWDFEISLPGDAELLARLPALSAMDGERCYWPEVVQDKRGAFFVTWKERHTKVPDAETFFAESPGRDSERIAKYRQLNRRYGPKNYAREITRREAFEIIASFWLPEEFHADAGLSALQQHRSFPHRSRMVLHAAA
jgi:hypothetical protein